MYMWVPSSLPCVTIESMSSRDRFCWWPYSAAQQPVQCRLQALVGSSRIAQGMFRWYFSRALSWTGQASRLPSTSRAFSNLVRIWGFSLNTRIMSSYQLPRLVMTSVNALRCTGNTLSGTSLLTSSMILSMCSSGFSSR